MRERDVAKHLIKQVEAAGGMIRKMAWEGRAHAPDYFVAIADVCFIETKAPGETPRPGQRRDFERMIENGARVITVDTKRQVDAVVKMLVDGE